jgi:hypothetical protein
LDREKLRSFIDGDALDCHLVKDSLLQQYMVRPLRPLLLETESKAFDNVNQKQTIGLVVSIQQLPL